MPNPWTSRTETAMHAPFHHPRNVERRGMDATSHVESRVSRDTDIIPYRRYGVHNNAVLDSYVYYHPFERKWYYRTSEGEVDQDFLDDYFSDRQQELNYRGIFHPRIKFENNQWVPNENTAPQTTLRESNPTFDSRHNASMHENTSSRQTTSGQNHSSKSKREPTDTMSRMMAMFKTTLGSYGIDEKPRRKAGGQRLSSMPIHEAPMWGRDETMVESTAHQARNEDRRNDLGRSRPAVVRRTTEREATELQQQLLPEERQPASSTMHSTDDAGSKGRTITPDSTHLRQSRCEEGEQSRTLTNVQETTSKRGEYAARLLPPGAPQSSNLQRREEQGLKGREIVPAAHDSRVDTAEPTRRKAEQEVRPQQEVLLRHAAPESIAAHMSQPSREDGEEVRVSNDTLRRARDEISPRHDKLWRNDEEGSRHEERRRRGDEGVRLQQGPMQLVVERASRGGMWSTPQTSGKADENARRQVHIGNGDESSRLQETSKDVVSGRRSSNDSDDEDVHRRTLRPRSGENRHLHGRLEDLVVGRGVERAGAPSGEYRRMTGRTTNDERGRRERREGKRDENARFLETSEKLVVERECETAGIASEERDAGLCPASHGDVEGGGENVPVKPGHLAQDDQHSRHGERRPGDESVRFLEESVHLVVGQGVDPGGEYCQTTESRTNDEQNRRVIEDRRDENVRLLEMSENLVMERGGERAGIASTERGTGYNPAPARSGERMVGNVPTLTSWNEGTKGLRFDLIENGVSAAWMADLPPSKTILEGDVPWSQSPARSTARNGPSPGYSMPQPSRHPSVIDQRDRRRSTQADESTIYSRHRERLKEDISRETRRSVSSQYSNACIGVYSPDTWGYRPQVHDHGLLQPPIPSSIVEDVDGRGRNESNREQEVAVQRRGACDTSHAQSRYVGPTRVSLAAHDAYWAKYSPSRAAGGKISPPATTEENEELEDVDDDNSSEAGYNSG